MPSAVQPGMLYLTGADVRRAASELDPVAVTREALLLHSDNATTLPEEAYLSWQTSEGTFARALALPGALWGAEPAIGVKLINSSLANPGRGLPRAQGVTILFDRETAFPIALMEAAFLSALRTSAYTALSAELLGPPQVAKIAVIGCGALGEAHARILADRYPGVMFTFFDQSGSRRDRLVTALNTAGLTCSPAISAEDAVRDAGIVVTATTTTTGYLSYDWLAAGALVAHVSLDDVLPEVVRMADLLVVDDWGLVSADDRRLLGRMFRSGELLGPHGEAWETEAPSARRVDTALADIVSGRHPGRRSPDQIVLSNPFGMGIIDVAMAAEVLRLARRLQLGTVLTR